MLIVTNLASISVLARDHATRVSDFTQPTFAIPALNAEDDGFDLNVAGDNSGLRRRPRASPLRHQQATAKSSRTFTADSTSVASGVVRLEARAIGTLGFEAPTPAIAADEDATPAIAGRRWRCLGTQGLRDNPLSRVDFYAAVDTDGGARVDGGWHVGTQVHRFGERCYRWRNRLRWRLPSDDNPDEPDTTDNDTRAFIYFLEMSEADFLAIVGGKGDYGAAPENDDTVSPTRGSYRCLRGEGQQGRGLWFRIQLSW